MAPNVNQILDVLFRFASDPANVAASLGDARDHLVSEVGGIPARAVGFLNAVILAYGNTGFEDSPPAAWGQLRGRSQNVGESIALKIGVSLRRSLPSAVEVQIYQLDLQRLELIPLRDAVRDERDALQAFRDLQFPGGNPGQADPPGQFVFQQLTATIAALNAQIQDLNGQIDQIATTIATLGG